jgi:hypothetical protein
MIARGKITDAGSSTSQLHRCAGTPKENYQFNAHADQKENDNFVDRIFGSVIVQADLGGRQR